MILSKFPSYCTRLSNMIKNLQFLNTYCEVFLQISLALLLSHLYSCVYFSRFTTTGIWLPVFPCPVLYVLLLPVCEMPYSLVCLNWSHLIKVKPTVVSTYPIFHDRRLCGKWGHRGFDEFGQYFTTQGRATRKQQQLSSMCASTGNLPNLVDNMTLPVQVQ